MTTPLSLSARVSTTPSNTAADPSDRVLVLEILRGRTAYPLRPIHTERFLIGAAPGCDLQLGGDFMPPLHSIIVRENGAVRLEAVAPSPELLVNRRLEQSVLIENGDHLAIGPFRIVVRQSASEIRHAVAPRAEARDGDARPISELTAAELVERIEAEEAVVRTFDERRQAGVQALLAASRTAARQSDAAKTGPATSTEDLDAPVIMPALRLLRVPTETPHDDQVQPEWNEAERDCSLADQPRVLDPLAHVLQRVAPSRGRGPSRRAA